MQVIALMNKTAKGYSIWIPDAAIEEAKANGTDDRMVKATTETKPASQPDEGTKV